jgi:uncharacterized damage-inducible protein DinB
MSRFAASLGIAATVAFARPVPAQQQGTGNSDVGRPAAKAIAGVRAELLKDLDALEKKYAGLAKAMSGKYGWRPAPGVRSVSEVFMHIAGDNYVIPLLVGVKAPATFAAADMQQAFASAQAMEKVTDEAKVQDALTQSFAHAKQAVIAVPDDQLDVTTKVFGQDMSKRQVLTLLVTHMHEHLGQSIAYARSNGVVPPWATSGD